jgi:t-SNARE complex subunit (syntaxin)
MATEINGKVHQQDSKLDDINKELEYNVEELHKANTDLETAANVSGKNNKCMCMALLVIAVIVIGAILTYVFVK